MKCPSCGANQPERAICEYCGRAMPMSTPQPAAQQQNAWQAPQANLHIPTPNPAEKSARHALIWSLVGAFVCCFPLSIVGLVLGLRARKEALQQKITVPVASTLAIVISALVINLSLAFGIWFGIDQARLDDRIKELTARISARDTEEVLAQQTACDMAELRILTDGWADDSSIVIDGFDCPGKVIQRETDAELPDFSFNTSSYARVTVTVCYKRGARWTVKAFREGAGCPE
jgi:hypothetical protein